ncbi:hypothetical protein BDQ12DRAFT_690337 [Crucibulum laeve]|uniref:Uncharacterized protein n=1 Tax=Crucibulum laeve TaxID=68775 RepID=A0A5C3LMQ9_9AGAR|nr:hypothetical protein BDQ12DRAFT_690337 [Crucibulum laeve]
MENRYPFTFFLSFFSQCNSRSVPLAAARSPEPATMPLLLPFLLFHLDASHLSVSQHHRLLFPQMLLLV